MFFEKEESVESITQLLNIHLCNVQEMLNYECMLIPHFAYMFQCFL